MDGLDESNLKLRHTFSKHRFAIIFVMKMALKTTFIHSLILLDRFLLLNSLLNAGGRHEICGTLKTSILSSVILRKHEIFSVFSILSLDFIDDLLDVW